MKIGIAPIKPATGNISRNVEKYESLIDLAVSNGAEFIFLPELLITGYAPKLAKELATDQDDPSIDPGIRLGVVQ